jgi:hypothetical protein
MAYVIPFIPYIAAAIGAAGAIRSANVQRNAADYNAQVREQQAHTTAVQTVTAEEEARRHARKVIGTQLAAISESGTGLSGSNLDLLNESLYNSEMDALNIRYQGDLQQRGLLEEAKQSRRQGRDAQAGGYLNAAGAALGAFQGYKMGTIPTQSQQIHVGGY